MIKYLCSALLLTATAGMLNAQTTPRPYFYEPALSPDGKEVAFVSGSDIWTAPANGGEARLMISNPAHDSRPMYSPDGSHLAFHSNRSGNGDIYVLHIPSGTLTRLTYDDGNDELSAWSKDGRYIYFSSSSREIAGMRDVYRVRSTGGTPMIVSGTGYVSEFFAAPSPDGRSLAFAARGIGINQWWRQGHSHLDESEIWVMNEGKYQQVAERGARQLWPMWSADGKTLFYVSDRNGHQNIWMHSLNGKPKQLTSFTGGRVLWPSISSDGNSIVFERDFGIWKYDIASNQAKPLSFSLRGAPAVQQSEYVRLSTGFRDLALSPDARKLAFTARGEVFVVSARDGGEATRVTNSVAREMEIRWLPNSRSIVYLSERGGALNLYQYDFLTGKEQTLTNSPDDESGISVSPDGKQIAFVRGTNELRVIDLSSRKERLVAKGYLARPPFNSTSVAWSPDGQWLAVSAIGNKSLRNVNVVAAAGGELRPASFLANTFGGSVVWTRDGKSILFSTGQRTENGNIARVDLVPRQPRFREDQFRDLFTDPATSPAQPPAVSPAKNTGVIDSMSRDLARPAKESFVFEGIRNRLMVLPLGVDANSIELSKDGKTALISANVGGQQNLYTYSLEELPREPATLRQLTFTSFPKSDAQFSSDGKEVYYLESGRINSVSLDTRSPKLIAANVVMDIDFNAEKKELFKQAWDLQNKGFYDEKFHGVNWAAVRKEYEPYAAGAQTGDELRRLLNLMVGELNASHSGVSAPPSAVITNTGRLGLRFDREAYEKDGIIKITEVISLSPADLSGAIKAGDVLATVDGTTLTAAVNLDQVMENKVDRRVVLGIRGANGATREVVVKPVNQATEKGLLYRQWVQKNRDYVAKQSGGRLGYVHMFDMSQGSLDQLYLDIDAENHNREGVVVDIRNNNGGFVNAYALDVLARRGYMTMTVRGLPPAPARVQLGQRALDAPTILVTNQHSLSDAEDFSEGYRTLGLGKIVGEPTGSWIIYTSNIPIMDGSVVRLPFIKITDNQGKDMELSPRPVDIPVSNPVGENNRDAQLDRAVQELLKQLKKE